MGSPLTKPSLSNTLSTVEAEYIQTPIHWSATPIGPLWQGNQQAEPSNGGKPQDTRSCTDQLGIWDKAANQAQMCNFVSQIRQINTDLLISPTQANKITIEYRL
ncbi:hypothetical protein HQ48_04620 [Porphyromonas sp. COT-290 OH3588]|nr:hypothetical protein HQ48_04620 [Porphyromonas sp. COT-290 OH3588]